MHIYPHVQKYNYKIVNKSIDILILHSFLLVNQSLQHDFLCGKLLISTLALKCTQIMCKIIIK